MNADIHTDTGTDTDESECTHVQIHRCAYTKATKTLKHARTTDTDTKTNTHTHARARL